MKHIYINGFSVASRLGMNRVETAASLFSSAPPRPDTVFELSNGGRTRIAQLPQALSDSLAGRTATNRLTSHLLTDIRAPLEQALNAYGPSRVAGVIGTSTTGIEEGIAPLNARLESGDWAPEYRFADQELGDTAAFLKAQTGLEGPCYTVSTACTSGSKALAAAARMIRSGVADAVVCGGVDTISRLTVNGFDSLDSVSPDACQPFSKNRCGINIGEGGALFVVSRMEGPWRLAGMGESSDAYHMSSPHPEGVHAQTALQAAMAQAGVSLQDVDFIHMHGTATPLNDAMESTLVNRVFGADKPCASTKGMTGHTLGAAGALQGAINLIAMDASVYPPHVFDGALDEALAPVRLTGLNERAPGGINHVLSASYAFGGSNIALVFGRS